MTNTLGLILVLLAAATARADSIYDPSLLTTSMESVSPLSGLAATSFGAGNGVYTQDDIEQQQLFEQWTNARNLGVTDGLLNLILALGGGSSPLMSQLYAPGAVFATPEAPVAVASGVVAVDTVQIVTQAQPSGSAPEPASIGLLAGATMLLLSWALIRVRKMKEPATAEASVSSNENPVRHHLPG
jgi:hypothetical protein